MNTLRVTVSFQTALPQIKNLMYVQGLAIELLTVLSQSRFMIHPVDAALPNQVTVSVNAANKGA